jgi:hypothetical protein
LRLLPQCVAMLIAVRLALTFVGLTRLRAMWLPQRVRSTEPLQAVRLARMVRVASRFVPFASCLTQAQAAQILLAWRGVASTVCLGVRETATGALEAHAWLLVDGRLVLGGEPHEIAGFRQLTALTAVR